MTRDIISKLYREALRETKGDRDKAEQIVRECIDRYLNR